MSSIHAEAVRQALKVYFIMGSVNGGQRDPVDVLTEAIDGGITCFQYREKGDGALTGQAKLRLALALRDICRRSHIPFIVNDDIELAIAAQADGIHVGQDDEPARSIRTRIGPGKIIGVSAHSVQEAQQAIADGADYLGIGPIFPTKSKADAKPANGTRLIEQLRASSLSIPIVGIGGITTDNAASVIRAGADGVSVISAIASAPSVRDAAAQFIASTFVCNSCGCVK